MSRIAIIGAGAAGCFCAILLKRRMPEADVHVFEAGTKPLAKVAITGGGRCNLTNTFNAVTDLRQVYPRGDKLMRRALSAFCNDDVWQWFEREGVKLVAQEDECVFPVSQDAMQIVNTLHTLMNRHGVKLHLHHRVTDITPSYIISFSNGETFTADSVVVTTGGSPQSKGYDWLRHLDLKIEEPLPSLFTFNIAGDWHQELMGTVVENATVAICGTKMKASGPLLLTHWGMSGPAILKLSSYGARWLAENNYKTNIVVNWFGDYNENDVTAIINDFIGKYPHRLTTSEYPRIFTSRHWNVILRRAGINSDCRWGGMNKKQVNRLVSTLTADVYEMTGRCHFKDEFVTCGGVSLKNINPSTMEAKKYPGLFFAGEVLDVDAITGGFNLQAAWSMAFMVASNVK